MQEAEGRGSDKTFYNKWKNLDQVALKIQNAYVRLQMQELQVQESCLQFRNYVTGLVVGLVVVLLQFHWKNYSEYFGFQHYKCSAATHIAVKTILHEYLKYLP